MGEERSREERWGKERSREERWEEERSREEMWEEERSQEARWEPENFLGAQIISKFSLEVVVDFERGRRVEFSARLEERQRGGSCPAECAGSSEATL